METRLSPSDRSQKASVDSTCQETHCSDRDGSHAGISIVMLHMVVILAGVFRYGLFLLCDYTGKSNGSQFNTSSTMLRSFLSPEVGLAFTTRGWSLEALKEAAALPVVAHISPYASGSTVVPPLVLLPLIVLKILHDHRLFFVFTIVVDALSALLLGRIVAYLRYQAFWGRPDLTTVVTKKEAEHDTTQTMRQTDSDDALQNGDLKRSGSKEASASLPTFLVERMFRAAHFISPETLALFWMLSPFNLAGSFFLSLHSLRSLVLIAAISFSLAPPHTRFPWFSGAACLGLAWYLYPLPSTLASIVPLSYACLTASHFNRRIDAVRHSSTMSPPLLDEIQPMFTPAPIPELLNQLLRATSSYTCVAGLVFCGLHWISFYIMGGSWAYWDACVTAILTVRDLTPNLGIFWYILQLVFIRYRGVYLISYQCLVAILALPLYFKFYRQPLNAIQVFFGALLIYQPQPVASDFTLLLCLLLLDMAVVVRMEAFNVLTGGLVISMTLFPAMASLWLLRNTGNPNFLYTTQLLSTAFASTLVVAYAKSALLFRSGDDGKAVEEDVGGVLEAERS